MDSHLFQSFRRMIETIPVKAVVRAAEAERRMVEDDLAKHRTPINDESTSILNFCTFLISAARGFRVTLPTPPIEHSSFYRSVIRRLIEAGELPWQVMEEADWLFEGELGGTGPDLMQSRSEKR